MTVLSACQRAAIQLNQQAPLSVFSTSDVFATELAYQANEAARDIMRDYDWRALTKKATFTGDGVTVGFAKPSNYDRMTLAGNMYSTSTRLPLVNVIDLDGWLELLILIPSGLPGYWTILEEEFQFIPTRASGEVVNFYYISKNFALDVASTPKSEFTQDTDTFILDETLLTLGIIWKWKEAKKLEATSDYDNFKTELEILAARDKGARTVTTSRRQNNYSMRVAYPGPLGP